MVAGGDKSSMAYLKGSALSGVMEIGLFHPADTVAKRLMSNTRQVIFTRPLKVDTAVLGETLFQHNVNAGPLRKFSGLFPGISFGAAYKVLQRTYKWGSQPLLKGWLDNAAGDHYRAVFGKKTGTDLMNACAGAAVGAGEVLILPLDVLKIKSQVNPDMLKGVGIFEIIRKERMGLYRGWNWTVARNMPGSFALFGVNSLVYTRLFDIDGPRSATFGQIFVASILGGTASITVASPMDVIKTRIQNKPLGNTQTGMSFLRDLIKKEGSGAFFKGLTPKLLLVAPKLVFGFTVAQWLIARFQDHE